MKTIFLPLDKQWVCCQTRQPLTKKVIVLPRSGKLKTTNPIEKEDVTARKKNIKELDELQVALSDAKGDKNRRIGK